MYVSTLRLQDDIAESISNFHCPKEGRSFNKMVNILLAEALNERDMKDGGSNLIDPMTGKFTDKGAF
jgi:hypothetical protein